MIDPSTYNISIKKIEDDGDIYFEAKVKEFPDLADYGDTYEEAYDLIKDSIETTYHYFKEKNKPFPSPIESNDDYSGRVTLRIPKTLHRFLSERSEEDSVSLNQQIVNILTFYSGIYISKHHSASSYGKITREKKATDQATTKKKGHLTLVSSMDSNLADSSAIECWR